jgi:hypothetical protein
MTIEDQTLYEVLGVGRGAKADEIAMAYRRIRTELQKESSAPNPRLATLAKVAFETLTNPANRAQYDASLRNATIPKPAVKVKKKSGGRKSIVVPVVAFLVVAGAGAGYYFFARAPAPSAQRPGEKTLSPEQIVQAVAPHLGRVQGALMSGEVRDLGVAVAMGENEMVTTCRGIADGMILTVRTGESNSRAELARANEGLDICTLTVKGAGEGIKLRPGAPGPQEKLVAVLVNAGGQPEARQVSAAGAIKEATGAAFALKTDAPLPNGAPVFDSQARLAGIVVSPHTFGEGIVAAFGASRIAQARGDAGQKATVPPASASAPAQAEPPAAESAARPTEPPPRRGPRGSIVSEGFTTLWKEDERGALIEVLDDPKTGAIGDPLAYWTLWTGRDVSRNSGTHCLVTFGPDQEVVADYDQIPGIKSADGYWYCALTRLVVNLMDLESGEYHFTIFVDGREVASKSMRIERKFWTRDKYAIIVVVLGIVLLIYVRGRKKDK